MQSRRHWRRKGSVSLSLRVKVQVSLRGHARLHSLLELQVPVRRVPETSFRQSPRRVCLGAVNAALAVPNPLPIRGQPLPLRPAGSLYDAKKTVSRHPQLYKNISSQTASNFLFFVLFINIAYLSTCRPTSLPVPSRPLFISIHAEVTFFYHNTCSISDTDLGSLPCSLDMSDSRALAPLL